ncbi:hypothetical protein PVK06_019348 [Gossypium arboreum]|uniref:CCHC-type domain-containing protein n=1 Tax=Gossypium arboreum TaxID=29729 RepID=A0ABR0PJL2_GOSAR|nr:hypothetical protein PVK06_019348 [Gossypium arboreum]
MLLDADARMQSIVSEIPSSANMVTHQQNASMVNSDETPTYHLTSGSSHGHGRGSMFASSIQCQLCGKVGHFVYRCYHRFDATYKSTGYRPPQENVYAWFNPFCASCSLEVFQQLLLS